MFPPCSSVLAKLICTTIRPEFRVPTDLFILCSHDHSTKIYGLLSFIISSARPFDQKIRSTLIYFFICTRAFDQKLGSPLIYFICTRSFGQKLGPPMIHFFYLHTTIRPNYRGLFHSLFLQCTIIRPQIRVLINLFTLFVHDHSTKSQGSY